jgi:Zinc binding domain
MIIDYCAKEELAVDFNCEADAAKQLGPERCRACGTQGALVSRKTVLLMLKPELLEQTLAGIFRFCARRDCSTVYFEEHGPRVFTTDDLRVIVGVKANSDPIPVCYCFGFDEEHFREEILQMGSTAIPDRISSFIRDGLCACEARNPSGVCCLGEVNRTAKRLKQ